MSFIHTQIKTGRLLSALLMLLVAAAVTAADSFTTVAPLTSVRSQASETVLPNGKVLVAGGSGVSGSLTSAEIYDPIGNTWTSTGQAMTSAHSKHCAVLLPNGLVLVAGGDGLSGPTGVAELYDPVMDTWQATAQPMNVARNSFTATLLQDGTVLVAGGNDAGGFSNTAEIYDPIMDTWTSTGTLSDARANHTATMLNNGTVMVTGGSDSGGFATITEVFDPAFGSWSQIAPLNTGRAFHGACLLSNGSVLVTGGVNAGGALNSAEIYDSIFTTWSPTIQPMGTARQRHTQTVLPSGKILVAGGFVAPSTYLASAEIYDPNGLSWTGTSVPLNAGRSFHVATRLPSGDVLLAGGSNAGGSMGSAEIYSEGAPTTPTIVILAGDNQIGAPSAPLPMPIVAQVIYQNGNPVGPGVTVTFAVTLGGGNILGGTTTTDPNGIAIPGPWTLGPVAGPNSLTVTSGSATPVIVNATGINGGGGSPAQIVIIAGDNQTAPVNTNVPIAPVVQVLDSMSQPVANALVTFAVTQGNIATTSPTTDSNGFISLASWTLGPVPGPNTLTCSCVGAPDAIFTATATVAGGTPTQIVIISGNNQTAPVNTSVPISPLVQVLDAMNQPVANVPVTFSVTQGSIASISPTTDINGYISPANWTLGTVTGTNTLTCSSAGLPTVFFIATASPGPVTQLIVTAGDNQTAAVGTAVAIAPTVQVLDSFNNFAAGASVTFAIASGGGSITGGNAVADVSGIATLGSWTLGTVSGTNTLTATSGTAPVATLTATGTGTIGNIFAITAFSTNDNPGYLGLPVSYTFSANDPNNSTLTYTFDFGDGSAVRTGSFAVGTFVTVTNNYSGGGLFPITLTVANDVASLMQTVTETIPVPPSIATGIPNVSDSIYTVVNPTNNLGISVLRSNGGIIQLGIDVGSLIRANVSVSTDWGDVAGRSAKVSGTTPVHQYVQHGIFVAKTTVTDKDTGKMLGQGRKTLVISSRETGETTTTIADLKSGRGLTGVAPSNAIGLRNIQGKFTFSEKSKDTVSFSGMIQLAAGLDLSKPHEFSVALGNVVVNTTLDARGSGGVPGTPAILRNLKVMYPKISKGKLTKGGESCRIDVTFSTAGLVAAGFDTEGIVKDARDLSSNGTAGRKIQVGMLLDGVPYESLPSSTLVQPKSTDFGTISGRTGR